MSAVGVIALRLALGARDLVGRLLASRAGQLVLLALVALLVGWLACRSAYHSGVSDEKAAQAARDKAAIKVVQHVAVAGKTITADVRRDLEDRRVQIRTVTQTLTKEVPLYVPIQSDLACTVPVGFVRLHDAAARGSALPGPAGGPVDAPSGVPLSSVAETDIFNYGVAYEWRDEALAWRTWYARQADLWAKNFSAPAPEPDRSPRG